jgi:hypothetical protein
MAAAAYFFWDGDAVLGRNVVVLTALLLPAYAAFGRAMRRRRSSDAPRSASRQHSARFPSWGAGRVWFELGVTQWNESPQAQEPPALGLSIVKPCFSMVSTKSMVAPPRYGPLIRSTITSTPPNS